MCHKNHKTPSTMPLTTPTPARFFKADDLTAKKRRSRKKPSRTLRTPFLRRLRLFAATLREYCPLRGFAFFLFLHVFALKKFR
jgi:hypothetical protein